VINVPDEKHLIETDYCGAVSGKNVDKFKQVKFTPVPSSKVKPSLIKECPVNIECKVRNILDLGTHHIFIAEVVAVHADADMLNSFEEIDYSKTSPIVYNQGEYWSLNKRIGEFGISRKLGKR
jgi:flavin reductase (DIM6/NTAB) family NADH-FMN oxidoreductase RutF